MSWLEVDIFYYVRDGCVICPAVEVELDVEMHFSPAKVIGPPWVHTQLSHSSLSVTRLVHVVFHRLVFINLFERRTNARRHARFKF